MAEQGEQERLTKKRIKIKNRIQKKCSLKKVHCWKGLQKMGGCHLQEKRMAEEFERKNMSLLKVSNDQRQVFLCFTFMGHGCVNGLGAHIFPCIPYDLDALAKQ